MHRVHKKQKIENSNRHELCCIGAFNDHHNITAHTMNINRTDSDLSSMLIITTNESGQQKPITSIPTIYPNDYDFDLGTGFKVKSTGSRSFSRPAKTLSQEHRNKSVPHSLQVCQIPLYRYWREFVTTNIIKMKIKVWQQMKYRMNNRNPYAHNRTRIFIATTAVKL